MHFKSDDESYEGMAPLVERCIDEDSDDESCEGMPPLMERRVHEDNDDESCGTLPALEGAYNWYASSNNGDDEASCEEEREGASKIQQKGRMRQQEARRDE